MNRDPTPELKGSCGSLLDAAGLSKFAITLRVTDVSLSTLDRATDRVLAAVASFGVDGFSVGPQYAGDPDPRIVVGIAEDNVELRKELAVLQQELGVAIVTYRSAPIMGG